jgi:hypothetical protein
MQACSQQKSKSKGQIKRSQPSAAPVGSRSAQEQVGWQAAFASRLAPTEKQKQTKQAVPPPNTMSASSSSF